MHRYIFDPHLPNVNDDECKKINDKFQRARENVRKKPPEKLAIISPPPYKPVGTFWPAGSRLQYPKSPQLCEQKPCIKQDGTEVTSETAQRGITPHSPRRQSLPQLKSQFAAMSGGPIIRRSLSVGQDHVNLVPEVCEKKLDGATSGE